MRRDVIKQKTNWLTFMAEEAHFSLPMCRSNGLTDSTVISLHDHMFVLYLLSKVSPDYRFSDLEVFHRTLKPKPFEKLWKLSRKVTCTYCIITIDSDPLPALIPRLKRKNK